MSQACAAALELVMSYGPEESNIIADFGAVEAAQWALLGVGIGYLNAGRTIDLLSGGADPRLRWGASSSSGGLLAPAPTGLAATAGNQQARLSWTASTGATSYHVKRTTTSGGSNTASSQRTWKSISGPSTRPMHS
jgi:hypothetical protein